MSDFARWRDAAGPLAPTAERFLAQHPGAPSHLPPGAAGLRHLVDAMDAWQEVEEVSAEQDEAFVEGAGAVLALLLLDHVGDGGHASRAGVHRLRLGRTFVDPFAIVDAALDADDPFALVRDAVLRVEAESRGESGLGRVLGLLETRLAALTPARRVVAGFEATVTLDDGVELDLRRVLTATEGEPDAAVGHALDRLLAMLPAGAATTAGWAELSPELLPRLVSPSFADGFGPEADLALEPLWGGVALLAFAVPEAGRSRFVRRAELAEASQEDVLAAAIRNLAARAHDARLGAVETDAGTVIMSRSGDGLDAARLLLPGLHPLLAAELGSPFLAAVPHRDALWACRDGEPSLESALAVRCRRDSRRAPHPVTERLFRVGANGVAPLRR